MKSILIWIAFIGLLSIRIVFACNEDSTLSDGTIIRITEQVKTEPIHFSTSQRITLRGYTFYLPTYPEINYGDFIVVEGEIKDKRLKKVKLVSIKENKDTIYALRNRLTKLYKKYLPPPHSSLVAGITIGSKGDIPQYFWKTLRNTGTTHVVVASGMNVTLVAKFLISVLVIFLPRRVALILALVGIWMYSVISGFDAPIIRAALMGSFTFTAQELGRLSDAWRTLLISAFIMLLIKPLWINDLGFILSFVATASLMAFNDKIRRKIHFIPSVLKDDFSTSIAAQIGVAPIIFVTFGQFNILSPLVNIFVLWTIVPITIIGFLSGAVGLIYEPLGGTIAFLAYPFTAWFIGVVNIFNSSQI